MSITFFDYQVLRLKADVVADATDFVTTQTIPVLADRKQLVSPTGQLEVPLTLDVTVEWLDVSDAVVVTGRGDFDVQFIKIVDRLFDDPVTQIVEDSVLINGGVAARPIQIDDARVGDWLSVYFPTITTAPAGATQMRVMYRVAREH